MLKSFHTENRVEAGCDEAGRGCLAGPVVAASVILPPDYQNALLNDSKQLSQKNREILREEIIREAVSWAVAEVDNTEIDKINILNASFLAMNKAVGKLKTKPEALLIDGNRFKPQHNIPYHCIIKGDGIYMSIAAASVLAKTFRDDIMTEFAGQYPHYGWETNAGYPTKKHREGIINHGITPLHRMSFTLLNKQMNLFD